MLLRIWGSRVAQRQSGLVRHLQIERLNREAKGLTTYLGKILYGRDNKYFDLV